MWSAFRRQTEEDRRGWIVVCSALLHTPYPTLVLLPAVSLMHGAGGIHSLARFEVALSERLCARIVFGRGVGATILRNWPGSDCSTGKNCFRPIPNNRRPDPWFDGCPQRRKERNFKTYSEWRRSGTNIRGGAQRRATRSGGERLNYSGLGWSKRGRFGPCGPADGIMHGARGGNSLACASGLYTISMRYFHPKRNPQGRPAAQVAGPAAVRVDRVDLWPFRFITRQKRRMSNHELVVRHQRRL